MRGVLLAGSGDDKPNLSGTWKLDQPRTESSSFNARLKLLIEQKDQNIHIQESRGPDLKEDISQFSCGTLGKQCDMQDGTAKANVSIYYNGPVLVVLKTNGRKGDSTTKWRLSLSSTGDALTLEVIHIDPKAKTERLVFSKSQ